MTGPSSHRDFYADITSKIIQDIEGGTLPWVQPWGRAGAPAVGLPRNASTGRAYSGINVLILWSAAIDHGFSAQHWLTFKQAQALGAQVRRGERGTTVVYADRFTPEREKQRAFEAGEAAASIPFLKRFTVFNADQIDGFSGQLGTEAALAEALIDPLVRGMIGQAGVRFKIGGDKAYYAPAEDYVQVPPPQAYFEPINWHRTALHEMSHATGHPSRLGRDQTGAFGSKAYAFEELVAEISAAFCCASLGIVPTVRHADYVASWLKVLREDDRAIVRAASQASKAADWLLQYAAAREGEGAQAVALAAAE
jgi:antirestriction protein ArdC